MVDELPGAVLVTASGEDALTSGKTMSVETCQRDAVIGRCVARCRPGYSEWWRRVDQWENDVPWNMSTSRCDCLDGTSLSRFPRTAAPNNRLNNIHHNTATCPKCIGRKDAYNFNNDSSLTVIHHHHHHHHHCMIRCKSCPSSKNSERTDI